MSDEPFTPFVQSWLRSSDPVPPEPLERSEQVMSRVRATRQLGRHWPPEALVPEVEPVGDRSTRAMTSGARVRWLPSRFSIVIAMLAALVVLLTANLLLREPTGPEQRGIIPLPGAEESPEPSKAISWITEPVSLEADALRLGAGDAVVSGIADGGLGVAFEGYGGEPDTRWLSADWEEQGSFQNLHLVLVADDTHWWISEIFSTDGTPDARGVVYDTTGIERIPLGQVLAGDLRLEGTADVDSSLVGPVGLEFDGLVLRAFEPGTGVDRVVTEVAGASVTGDTQMPGIIRVIDDGTSHGLENVRHVAVTPDGRSWAATSTHLYEVGAEGGLRAVDGGPRSIEGLVAGADGRLLVPADDDGWLPTDGHSWLESWSGSESFDEAAITADGSLWGVSSEAGEMFGRIDVLGTMTTSGVEPADGSTADLDDGAAARSLVAVPDGSVWVAAGSAIRRFDGEDRGTIDGVHEPFGTYEAGQRVLDLAANTEGMVWTLLEDRAGQYLGRYDGSTWSLHAWDDVVAGLPDEAQRSWAFPDEIAAVLSDGTVMVAPVDVYADTGSSALLRYDGRAARVAADVTFDDFAATPDGRAWATGWSGLHLLDPAEWPEVTAVTGSPADQVAPGRVVLDLRPSRRLEQVVAYLQRQTEDTDLALDPEAFLQLAREPGDHWRERYPFLREAPEGSSLEGFLASGTYEAPVDTAAEDLVARMLEEWGERMSPYVAEADRRGVDFYDALVIASLVERQAVHDADRARIAGVYWNRLDPDVFGDQTGGLLNADPAVVYATDSMALEDLPVEDWDGYRFWDLLGVEDYSTLEVDPEYASFQTYRATGLPDWPIVTPSPASMAAALDPDTGDGELFFFACPGSTTHVFAKTFEEHLENTERCD